MLIALNVALGAVLGGLLILSAAGRVPCRRPGWGDEAESMR